MRKTILLLLVTASFASCSNNKSSGSGSAADTITTITSGNTDARQGQVIPRDSVETSADSTGNIHPGDTTKK